MSALSRRCRPCLESDGRGQRGSTGWDSSRSRARRIRLTRQRALPVNGFPALRSIAAAVTVIELNGGEWRCSARLSRPSPHAVKNWTPRALALVTAGGVGHGVLSVPPDPPLGRYTYGGLRSRPWFHRPEMTAPSAVGRLPATAGVADPDAAAPLWGVAMPCRRPPSRRLSAPFDELSPVNGDSADRCFILRVR